MKQLYRINSKILGRLVLTLALLLIMGRAETNVQAASTNCNTSTPPSNAYTVTVCITTPADGATVMGPVAVTGTVTVTGTNPGSQQLIYWLDNQYLLTDFATPYSFTLPTAKFVDGTHLLQVQAFMRDGYTTPLAGINLVFNNGVTTPPVNNGTFTPTSGIAPGPGSPFVVAAVGDAAGGEPNAASVVNLIASWNPNLFLYLGDVYEKGSPSEFYNWYAPSNFYGQFRSITNPTVGNHEYSGGSGGAGYFDYWNNVPHYYSVNANGWHMISLDSSSQFNQTAPGSAQYNWLAQDLAANPNACTIAYYHHPVNNVGPEGDSPRLDSIWALLAQYQVPIVLNGHDHNYQRWMPLDGSGNPSSTGVTEFVAGAGGHGTQQFVRSDSRLVTAFTNAMAFGALRFVLNPTGANFAYINTQGTVLDSGVVPCPAAGADTTPPSTPAGLTAASSTANQVNLSWNAATDNTGVAGYVLYRNGAQLATLGAAAQSYADTSTVANMTYAYTVYAFDPAGNYSAASAPATLTTSNTYIFTPSADAYVNQGAASTNYGTATTLKLDASPDLHAYLRFNVQNLVGTISNATLRLYPTNSSSFGYQVRGVANNTWTETGITFSNAPALSSTVTGSSGGITSGVWSAVDITSLVAGNSSLNLGLSTTSTTTFNLASRETGANSPQLVIQVVQSSPTSTPTATATTAPSATATPTTAPSATPTGASPTFTPTDTATPTPASTNTPLPTATPTNALLPTPTWTSTPSTTTTPTSTPTQTNTPAPTNTLAPTPTATSTLAQTMVAFIPAADSYVNASFPSTNYGTSTSIRVDGSPVMNSYIRFSVSGLSGAIKSATLRVFSNSSSSAGYSVRSVADNTWTETGITYSNAPAFSSTITGSSGSFATGVWTSVDVTSLITGNGTYNLALISTGAQTNLASRESGATAPQLVIVTN